MKKWFFRIFIASGVLASLLIFVRFGDNPQLRKVFDQAKETIASLELKQSIKFIDNFEIKKILSWVDTSGLIASLRKFKEKVRVTNRYELVALHLSRENREFRAKISKFRYRISELQAENKFFELKFKQTATALNVAQRVSAVDGSNDMVHFATYQWEDRELLKMARYEWQRKNNAKAAQYFYTLVQNYPQSALIDDVVLFQTGVASFQSKIYYSWAENSLGKLISQFPDSKYYRGAKLWRALASFEQGNKQQFYRILEEFRAKYQNTPEGKILSKHYAKSKPISNL